MSIKRALGRVGVMLSVAVMALSLSGCVGTYEPSGSSSRQVGSHNTPSPQETVNMTDSTVTINGLIWTRKNLNIDVSDSSWCCNNDSYDHCGRMYRWGAALRACQSMGEGWRLPDTTDWNNLVDYAGGRMVAGKKLKSKKGWAANGNGTDDYGFSALPVENCYYGQAGGYGNNAPYWSATVFANNTTHAYYYNMNYGHTNMSHMMAGKDGGYPVRCVRDAEDKGEIVTEDETVTEDDTVTENTP